MLSGQEEQAFAQIAEQIAADDPQFAVSMDVCSRASRRHHVVVVVAAATAARAAAAAGPPACGAALEMPPTTSAEPPGPTEPTDPSSVHHRRRRLAEQGVNGSAVVRQARVDAARAAQRAVVAEQRAQLRFVQPAVARPVIVSMGE